MRPHNRFQACLIVLLGALIPIGTMAAGLPAGGSIAALNVSAAVGQEAARVSGTLPGTGRLQAVLYAQVSADLPTVLLNRRPLATDANGRFNATFPIAPMYFQGAVITVVVQSPSGTPLARGAFTVGPPNVAGPADVLPPDYR
jgi:hypothetical protein